MTVTLLVPTYLRRFTGGETSVSVEPYAATVGEALTLLYERYPGVRDRVQDERGAVRLHVNVFVDGENIRHTGGLATPVVDGAEIAIIPAVSGGSANDPHAAHHSVSTRCQTSHVREVLLRSGIDRAMAGD